MNRGLLGSLEYVGQLVRLESLEVQDFQDKMVFRGQKDPLGQRGHRDLQAIKNSSNTVINAVIGLSAVDLGIDPFSVQTIAIMSVLCCNNCIMIILQILK